MYVSRAGRPRPAQLAVCARACTVPAHLRKTRILTQTPLTLLSFACGHPYRLTGRRDARYCEGSAATSGNRARIHVLDRPAAQAMARCVNRQTNTAGGYLEPPSSRHQPTPAPRPRARENASSSSRVSSPYPSASVRENASGGPRNSSRLSRASPSWSNLATACDAVRPRGPTIAVGSRAEPEPRGPGCVADPARRSCVPGIVQDRH